MRTASQSRRRLVAIGVAALSVSALLAGCATQQQAESGTGPKTGGSLYSAAVAEAKSIANGQKLNASLTMLGSNSGVEGQTLQQVYKAFTAGAHVTVNYTGSQDIQTLLQSRVQAGSPPDVADIQPGIALGYAKQGKLDNLSAAFGSELKSNFDSALLAGASYKGNVIGIYQGFSNFMLWYNPTTYTGPKNPTSWSQIVDWTNTEAAKGTPVWCAAQNAGGGSGFPGAQFMENIFLKKYGPALYKQWGEGTLSWTSPQVKDAWQQFGALIGNNKNVSGGVAGILSASIATGYNGLTSSPASCQATVWGSWVPGLIGTTAVPGKTIAFYRVPASNPQYANDELFQSTVSVGFTNNATTKAFLKFMASDAAQRYLASLDRWPVADKNVSPSVYSSSVLRQSAQVFFGSSGTKLAVGPNVLASGATAAAEDKGIVAYLQHPAQLDSILAGIEATVKN